MPTEARIVSRTGHNNPLRVRRTGADQRREHPDHRRHGAPRADPDPRSACSACRRRALHVPRASAAMAAVSSSAFTGLARWS